MTDILLKIYINIYLFLFHKRFLFFGAMWMDKIIKRNIFLNLKKASLYKRNNEVKKKVSCAAYEEHNNNT